MQKLLKDKIGNFRKQAARTAKKYAQAGSKADKKDVFAPVLARLGEAAGGNLSAPICGGNATSAGAAQMANLSSTLTACSDTIDEVCNQDNLPTHNFTNDEACLADMDTFEDYVTECSALRDLQPVIAG